MSGRTTTVRTGTDRADAANILPFLRMLAGRPDLLRSLRAGSKDEVVAAAATLGFPFTAAQFDARVWELETRLAATRSEPFDANFPLWQALWGTYYLEFLVDVLAPSLAETGLA